MAELPGGRHFTSYGSCPSLLGPQRWTETSLASPRDPQDWRITLLQNCLTLLSAWHPLAQKASTMKNEQQRKPKSSVCLLSLQNSATHYVPLSQARELFSETAGQWWQAVQQRSEARWTAASLSTLIPSRILHIAMAGLPNGEFRGWQVLYGVAALDSEGGFRRCPSLRTKSTCGHSFGALLRELPVALPPGRRQKRRGRRPGGPGFPRALASLPRPGFRRDFSA